MFCKVKSLVLIPNTQHIVSHTHGKHIEGTGDMCLVDIKYIWLTVTYRTRRKYFNLVHFPLWHNKSLCWPQRVPAEILDHKFCFYHDKGFFSTFLRLCPCSDTTVVTLRVHVPLRRLNPACAVARLCLPTVSEKTHESNRSLLQHFHLQWHHQHLQCIFVFSYHLCCMMTTVRSNVMY